MERGFQKKDMFRVNIKLQVVIQVGGGGGGQKRNCHSWDPPKELTCTDINPSQRSHGLAATRPWPTMRRADPMEPSPGRLCGRGLATDGGVSVEEPLGAGRPLEATPTVRARGGDTTAAGAAGFGRWRIGAGGPRPGRWGIEGNEVETKKMVWHPPPAVFPVHRANADTPELSPNRRPARSLRGA